MHPCAEQPSKLSNSNPDIERSQRVPHPKKWTLPAEFSPAGFFGRPARRHFLSPSLSGTWVRRGKRRDRMVQNMYLTWTPYASHGSLMPSMSSFQACTGEYMHAPSPFLPLHFTFWLDRLLHYIGFTHPPLLLPLLFGRHLTPKPKPKHLSTPLFTFPRWMR